MESFGLVGKEFINLYSAENPILETGDQCFFMFTNTEDYHRPLIGFGIIVYDKFTDGMTKDYWIKINCFYESPTIIDKFILNKPFNLYPYNSKSGIISGKKLTIISPNFDYENNLIKIDCFFIRKTEEQINKLRNDYISVIRKDIESMLKDIDSI